MKLRKLMQTWVSLLAVLGLTLTGCAPPAASTPKPVAPTATTAASSGVVGGATPSPSPKPTAEQPRYGGNLDRANFDDPPNLDIHQVQSTNAHLSLANIYSGLVRYDPVEVTKVIPDLAEKWEVSTDGKSYTFNLRKGVKWHDGKPLTSADAKFSIERMAFWKEHKIISPRGGALLTAVQSAEAPDENTLKVTLKYPNGSFITNAASSWVMVVPKHVVEAKGDMKKDAVGTGPFKWKRYDTGVLIEMVKNEDYFIKGRPYLDGVRIYTIRDDATRLAAFRTGRVKMTPMSSKGLTHAEADIVRKEMADKAVVRSHAALSRWMLIAKISTPPWNDIRVRRAVDLAFDRQAAIKINYNVGVLGAAMDPKGAWGIPEEEIKALPGYRQPKDADMAEAKRLMAEAGLSNGFKIKLLGRSGGSTEKQAVVMRDQLAKIGITVDLDIKESGVAMDVLNNHQFDTASWIFTDPMDDPDVGFGGFYMTGGARNYEEYSNKRFDELYEKQAQTLDTAERKKLVRRMQEMLLEDIPITVIFWDVYNMGHWKEVMGYLPGPGPFSHNSLDYVWLTK